VITSLCYTHRDDVNKLAYLQTHFDFDEKFPEYGYKYKKYLIFLITDENRKGIEDVHICHVLILIFVLFLSLFYNIFKINVLRHERSDRQKRKDRKSLFIIIILKIFYF